MPGILAVNRVQMIVEPARRARYLAHYLPSSLALIADGLKVCIDSLPFSLIFLARGLFSDPGRRHRPHRSHLRRYADCQPVSGSLGGKSSEISPGFIQTKTLVPKQNHGYKPGLRKMHLKSGATVDAVYVQHTPALFLTTSQSAAVAHGSV